jgi:hypothetical protein
MATLPLSAESLALAKLPSGSALAGAVGSALAMGSPAAAMQSALPTQGARRMVMASG